MGLRGNDFPESPYELSKCICKRRVTLLSIKWKLKLKPQEISKDEISCTEKGNEEDILSKNNFSVLSNHMTYSAAYSDSS